MSNTLVLGAEERVETRSFTHPEHSQVDVATMRHMVRQLVDTYDEPEVCDFTVEKGAVCMSDPNGRHFRIYYIQPQRLFSQNNISVVGFFGRKRPNADIRPLLLADKRFERTFNDHPDLLSLSTLRLASGDFANLVLFADPDAIDRWNYSPVHYDTVQKISPPYYECIRLNNGVLPGGLSEPKALRLIRVKYIDYRSEPPWRALRRYEKLGSS